MVTKKKRRKVSVKPLRKNGHRHMASRVLLSLCAAVILIPLVLTFLYSFFSPSEIKAYLGTRNNYDSSVFMDILLSPRVASLSQYYDILIKDTSVLRMFLNSAFYVAAILLGQALVIPAMAYALSRFRFPGRDVLFFLIIMLMLLPFQVTMVPNVLTLRSIGLLNTVWAVILPMWFTPFYVFLIRQFMVGLPDELLEAAQMDGAGTVRCYWQIVLPVCKPVIGAAVALSFADNWNLVEQPMTYLNQRADLQPLSVMFNQLVSTPSGIEFAGATLYILPALFVYLFFQEDILSGVQLTELK